MVKLPGTPSRKRTLVATVVAAATIGIVAFVLVYFLLFPTSSPKKFSLEAQQSTGAATTGATTSGSASSTTGATPSDGPSTFKVASGSQAGYRVREKLAFLAAQSDAVGRTSQVSGTATVSETATGASVKAASFSVAVNTLTSDKSQRDEKIHQIGLESDRYPTATFTLIKPITLPASALKGTVAHVSATGTFDIHGVSKIETVPLEMTISGSTLEAAGALTFPWSEFGMTAPSVGGFVNVTDKATMEFDLRLARA